jgi:thioredoxin
MIPAGIWVIHRVTFRSEQHLKGTVNPGEKPLAEQDFFERLKDNPRPVVVDFWAVWCGPCRMVEPVLKKLAKQYEGKVDLWKVNADEQPELLRKLKIYGIPTLVGFNGGEEVFRHTGAGAQDILERVFTAAISGERPAQTGPGVQERIWRITIGGVLLIFAYAGGFKEWYLLLGVIGGIVILSAVIDTFSFWQKIAARSKKKE